jgi:hypothetical protein
VGDLLAKVVLGHLLHLAQNHGGDLLGGELLVLAVDGDCDEWLAILFGDLEGEVLDITLNSVIRELLTDQTPGNPIIS